MERDLKPLVDLMDSSISKMNTLLNDLREDKIETAINHIYDNNLSRERAIKYLKIKLDE